MRIQGLPSALTRQAFGRSAVPCGRSATGTLFLAQCCSVLPWQRALNLGAIEWGGLLGWFPGLVKSEVLSDFWALRCALWTRVDRRGQEMCSRHVWRHGQFMW